MAVQWLDVPFVRQPRNGCGAAAIAMVMQYWMREADENRIYALLSGPKREQMSGEKLRQYLEDHGFSAHAFSGERRDLEEHLQKGRPLVVCLAPGGISASLHYVVLVGLTNDAAFYHDPVRGKLI